MKYNSVQDRKYRTFDRRFWIILIGFLFFIAAILSFPYLFTTRSWLGIDFMKSGQIGDTLGGILGPFIAIGAAILTFLAFWVQYKANEQQKFDLKMERFENRFYQLIQIHRNNVAEMTIRNRVGRKGFINMFNEFKFVYLTIMKYYREACALPQIQTI